MSASVKDVAALAGVSASTVSNYLNRPQLLSPATAERVRTAVARLDFVPNESARQLRAGSSKAIALILLDAWLPFFSELSRGVEDVTRTAGWSLFFSNSARDAEQELRNIEMFEAHRAQGIVISPLGDVIAPLERLARAGIRSTVIGPPHSSGAVGSILFDDRLGGELAGAHLRALGRRHVAFLGDPAAVVQSADRHRGLVHGLVGSDAIVQIVPTASLTIEVGIDAATRILDGPSDQRPDAVFAANDMLAIGAQTALLRRGIRIPQEIAIVGFDDVDQAHQSVVPLTTIRQPGYEIGAAAGRSLLAQLARPKDPPPAVTPFVPELIVRASTVGD